MVTTGFVLLGSAWVAFIVTLKLIVLGIVALAALLFLSVVLRGCMFRPQENHVGVIYRLGRLSRLVGPDEWVRLIPGVDVVETEISLDPRRVEIRLSGLWTRDRIPVNCELIVFYRVDVRRAREDLQPQMLHIPDEGWGSVVKTALYEVAAWAVGFQTLEQLISPQGRADLKRTLSALLADRLKGMGVLVNPQYGVTVGGLEPAPPVWHALVDGYVAKAQGDATRDRLRPLLDELRRQGLGVGLDALLLGLAAAVAEDGAAAQPLAVAEQAAVVTALLGRGAQHVASGQPANGKAIPNGDGKYQMELPWDLE